jgi:hypothetical protein
MDVLGTHRRAVRHPQDLPARTVGGHRVIPGSDRGVPEPAILVGRQQGPHRQLTMQLLGLLDVVEPLAVAVPYVDPRTDDRVALGVDDPRR